MARGKVLCGLAAPLVALVAAAGAGASTAAGGVTHVWRNTPGYIASSGSCAAFRPAPAVEQTGLVAVTRGSYGTPYESNGAQLQQVHVTAQLSGTILDADGNRYRASGTSRPMAVALAKYPQPLHRLAPLRRHRPLRRAGTGRRDLGAGDLPDRHRPTRGAADNRRSRPLPLPGAARHGAPAASAGSTLGGWTRARGRTGDVRFCSFWRAACRRSPGPRR